MHVPVADLNGDGRPDFVALISQEHETVVAFLNAGNNRFLSRSSTPGPTPPSGRPGSSWWTWTATAIETC
ncbi:MAG: VCBS repeat-containing protein [Singulisphaera sp.]